jgi:hypothetical protein
MFMVKAYNIKIKLYKKDFAELPFVNVVLDRMVMIYMEFVIFSLFAMHLDYWRCRKGISLNLKTL